MDNDHTCPICLCVRESLTFLNCFHSMCMHCIKKLIPIGKQKLCPFCRTVINQEIVDTQDKKKDGQASYFIKIKRRRNRLDSETENIDRVVVEIGHKKNKNYKRDNHRKGKFAIYRYRNRSF